MLSNLLKISENSEEVGIMNRIYYCLDKLTIAFTFNIKKISQKSLQLFVFNVLFLQQTTYNTFKNVLKNILVLAITPIAKFKLLE